MEIKFQSYFKNPDEDKNWFNRWVEELEKVNNKHYERIEVQTTLGKTHIWGLNTTQSNLETIVIFPGARTSVLFWDFDNNLAELEKHFRIFLVETNGLPNLSDGATPDIKSLGYGE
ncbi:MAG TPA: alpha/beta hydrolase, partial [Cyclobacteriaceae bacterium]